MLSISKRSNSVKKIKIPSLNFSVVSTFQEINFQYNYVKVTLKSCYSRVQNQHFFSINVTEFFLLFDHIHVSFTYIFLLTTLVCHSYYHFFPHFMTHLLCFTFDGNHHSANIECVQHSSIKFCSPVNPSIKFYNPVSSSLPLYSKSPSKVSPGNYDFNISKYFHKFFIFCQFYPVFILNIDFDHFHCLFKAFLDANF